MRNKENKHLGLEIEPDLHAKLKYIAKYDDRSINGEIVYLIKQAVRKFENENGKIDTEQEQSVLAKPAPIFYYRLISFKNLIILQLLPVLFQARCYMKLRGIRPYP